MRQGPSDSASCCSPTCLGLRTDREQKAVEMHVGGCRAGSCLAPCGSFLGLRNHDRNLFCHHRRDRNVSRLCSVSSRFHLHCHLAFTSYLCSRHSLNLGSVCATIGAYPEIFHLLTSTKTFFQVQSWLQVAAGGRPNGTPIWSAKPQKLLLCEPGTGLLDLMQWWLTGPRLFAALLPSLLTSSWFSPLQHPTPPITCSEPLQGQRQSLVGVVFMPSRPASSQGSTQIY